MNELTFKEYTYTFRLTRVVFAHTLKELVESCPPNTEIDGNQLECIVSVQADSVLDALHYLKEVCKVDLSQWCLDEMVEKDDSKAYILRLIMDEA